MRLDLVLHRLCLFKTRSQAGKACDQGRVRLNGESTKASRTVAVGDKITFRDPAERFEKEVEILSLPEKQVSKAQAKELYREIASQRVESPWEN